MIDMAVLSTPKGIFGQVATGLGRWQLAGIRVFHDFVEGIVDAARNNNRTDFWRTIEECAKNEAAPDLARNLAWSALQMKQHPRLSIIVLACLILWILIKRDDDKTPVNINITEIYNDFRRERDGPHLFRDTLKELEGIKDQLLKSLGIDGK